MVNDSNPATKMSRMEVRKIFAGEERSWSAGVPIRIFVRAPGTHERAVLFKLLGMTEGEYRHYWTAQVFRGEAETEPMTLPSNGMPKRGPGRLSGCGRAWLNSRRSRPA